jgi:two-component system response regulator RegA
MSQVFTEVGVKMMVVDDDATFRNRLVKALASRGIEGHGAADADEAISLARSVRPGRAVVDLRMPGRSGLQLVRELTELDGGIRIVVLTGYGSIATAVEAVKLGAVDYLTKPADTEQILAAFRRSGEVEEPAALPEAAPSLARMEWEHIQRILGECSGNVSEAARKLGIHRRSLQRKLTKLPPLE